MRNIKWLVLLISLMFISLFWGAAVAQEQEMCVPMGNITLEGAKFTKLKKTP